VTFQTATYAVDGNSENGNFLRLMLNSATIGSEGVVGHLDCQVNANSPATSGIVITTGAVVIAGTETSYQGSYYGYNVGNDTTCTVPATGGSAQSYMVIARAEDPTWSGSPWTGPAAGQIIYPRVISCAAGATLPPATLSAIPLARVDMPASTSVVQQSYIHDLRYVCTPQRIMEAFAWSGVNPSTNWTVSTTPHAWPPGASWQVFIPAWCTTAVLSWTLSDVYFSSSSGNGNARGFLYPVLGSSVTSPALAFQQTLTSVNVAQQGSGRHAICGSAQASVGPSLRGTTQTLQFAQTTDGVQTGINYTDESSQIALLVEFQQLAATI